MAVLDTPQFEAAFKEEVRSLDSGLLPLQAGLQQSSYVSESDRSVVVLNVSEKPDVLCVKAGVFYAGVVAGACCSDDPSPLCEQTEYCEMQFDIDKKTAETTVRLLPAE